VFDRRFFILGVFLLLFALGTVEGPRGDAGWRLVITEQILDFGRLHVPEQPDQPVLIETASGWTSFSPIGQTLLFIPFEFAGKVLSVTLGDYRARAFPRTYLYCPLVGVAYFLALLALLESFGLSSRAAGITSLVFTFCSLPAYYVAQSFQEEAIASVFVCLSLRAALLWRRSPEKRYAFEAGLFGASIFLFRMNGIFALIPVAVLFAQGLHAVGVGSSRALQTAGAALVGALGPAVVHAIFAYLRFGNPLSTGYDQLAPEVFDRTLPDAWLAFQIDAVMNLLFGLGKGLFIYSPLLAIAFWGLWIKRARLAPYAIVSLLALAGSILLSVTTIPYFLDGCWSWGARYQVHLFPLFAYPAWEGMRYLFARRMGKVLLATALGFGLFSQLCAMVGSDRIEYLQVLPISKLQREVCPIVREHQFAMRVSNISSVIRLAGEDVKTKDPVLHREFGTLWGLRLARNLSPWAKATVVLTWLGIFAGAAACFRRALRA
jgi:hypothetical protein